MNAILLGGFLGSGKTTTLMQLACTLTDHSKSNTAKVAIIENEIGEISIDTLALGQTGYTVRSLFSGCICCTMSSDLVSGILDIQKTINPEWIIIEATGLAYPSKIINSITQFVPDCHITSLLLVDADRIEELLELLTPLITKQLQQADVILLNKIDLVNASRLPQIHDLLSKYNQGAKIIDICAKNGIDSSVWLYAFPTLQLDNGGK